MGNTLFWHPFRAHFLTSILAAVWFRVGSLLATSGSLSIALAPFGRPFGSFWLLLEQEDGLGLPIFGQDPLIVRWKRTRQAAKHARI